MSKFNISLEKMLFYNDLHEYRISIEGKQVDTAFINNDTDNLETLLNNYYVARNSDNLHYDDIKELESAKENDRYLARLYQELD